MRRKVEDSPPSGVRPRYPQRWVGIVLCGGASTRMGTDKASMGDPPWAHRVAGALEAGGCDAVELQGGVAGLGTTRWRHFPDALTGAGPVAAVLQAAARHGTAGVVFAACDLPHLTGRDVEKLVRAAGDGSAAYLIGRRANWSLVASGPPTTRRMATSGPDAGIDRSLNALFGPTTKLLDPVDPVSVTDIDGPPGNLEGVSDTREP